MYSILSSGSELSTMNVQWRLWINTGRPWLKISTRRSPKSSDPSEFPAVALLAGQRSQRVFKTRVARHGSLTKFAKNEFDQNGCAWVQVIGICYLCPWHMSDTKLILFDSEFFENINITLILSVIWVLFWLWHLRVVWVTLTWMLESKPWFWFQTNITKDVTHEFKFKIQAITYELSESFKFKNQLSDKLTSLFCRQAECCTGDSQNQMQIQKKEPRLVVVKDLVGPKRFPAVYGF